MKNTTNSLMIYLILNMSKFVMQFLIVKMFSFVDLYMEDASNEHYLRC